MHFKIGTNWAGQIARMGKINVIIRLPGNPNGSAELEDLDIDGRIKLKWMCEKQAMSE
jgi:hypothetical protein